MAALPDDRAQGMKIARRMTDNGAAYRSQRFARRLRRLKITRLRTKPYTPRTPGRAGRFIQMLLRDWVDAYRYPSSAHRAGALVPWRLRYNFRRPYSAVGHWLPATRFGFAGNNVLGNYRYLLRWLPLSDGSSKASVHRLCSYSYHPPPLKRPAAGGDFGREV